MPRQEGRNPSRGITACPRDSGATAPTWSLVLIPHDLAWIVSRAMHRVEGSWEIVSVGLLPTQPVQ